jgi:hypothetical protein
VIRPDDPGKPDPLSLEEIAATTEGKPWQVKPE